MTDHTEPTPAPTGSRFPSVDTNASTPAVLTDPIHAEITAFLARAGLRRVVVLSVIDNTVADAITPEQWADHHAQLERAYQVQQQGTVEAEARR